MRLIMAVSFALGSLLALPVASFANITEQVGPSSLRSQATVAGPRTVINEALPVLALAPGCGPAVKPKAMPSLTDRPLAAP